MKAYKFIVVGIIWIGVFSCKTDKSSPVQEVKKEPVKIPVFNQDSAYNFVQKQVDFGFRVPGTDEHKACKEWMVKKFESFGADVQKQDFNAKIYTGDVWESSNIIASFNPKLKNRILLSAHYDTRFISEEDEDETKRDQPTLGADDGGSGVGVLLEIARIINDNPIDLGVDIVLWDAEDQGQRGGKRGEYDHTWCLGSQYWARNKHTKNYNAKYAINLDMVGTKNPTFHKEGYSLKYARDAVNKIWAMAGRMGYNDMFVNKEYGVVTDDHRFISEIGGIPALDIINQDATKQSFQKCWHTQCDDMAGINKRSLRVVGQVVTAVIYKESEGTF